MVDVVTGDANSACNRLSKSQLASHPEISAMNVAMEGIVTCFNQAQKEPLNHLRISKEVSASRRSILESSLNYGTKAGLEHDGFYGVLDCLARRGNTGDNFEPDEQPLGNIFPD